MNARTPNGRGREAEREREYRRDLTYSPTREDKIYSIQKHKQTIKFYED